MSPFLNGVKCLLDLAAMVCQASSCAASASSQAARRVFSLSSTAGIEECGNIEGVPAVHIPS